MILKVATRVKCPHCGQRLTIQLDLTEPDASWLEDCTTCHKPISFTSNRDRGQVTAEQARA